MFAVAEPPRLPLPADHLIGHLMRIPADRCRYRDAGLALLVRRVRLDISRWYGGVWVWLEGDELADTGHSLGRTQALVHVSACVTEVRVTGNPGQPLPLRPATR